MKQILFFSFMILFQMLGQSSWGQQSKILELSYSTSDFIIEDSNQGFPVISFSNKEFTYKEDFPSPALPYETIYYLIHNDEEYEGITIYDEEKLVLQDITLGYNPDNVDQNGDLDSEIEIAYDETIYPDSNVVYTGTLLVNGFKILSFAVCPFRYDAANKRLYLKKNLQIEIALKPSTTATQHADATISESTFQTLSDIIVNKNDFCSQFVTRRTENRNMAMSDDYEYIIITNSELRPAFQKLSDWKSMKGCLSKVLTTQEISQCYNGNSLQEKIKRAIYDYYNGTHHGLKYVLLGGDVDIVPSRMCFIEKKNLGKPSTIDETPTDMYYSCFDNNFEWDANGNNVYGEEEDSVDISPEISIGRIPVRTQDEANSFIRKLIDYEYLPENYEWKDTILMSGTNLFMLNISDGEIKSDSLYQKHIEPFWSGQRQKFFLTYSDFPEIGIAEWTPQNMHSLLGKGYPFVDVICHGETSWWKMQQSTQYNTSFASNLHNSGYSIITTSACHTNAFDSDTCLSEAFLRNPNCGIIGYYGCSRQAFESISLKYLRPTLAFIGDYYSTLFRDKSGHFGEIIKNSKLKHVSESQSFSDSYRWMMFGLNMLGDPEMQVFTRKPNVFRNVNINVSNNRIFINTGVDSCLMCVTRLSELNQPTYEVTQVTNNLQLDVYTYPFSVCISKPDYTPYFIECSEYLIMQNRTENHSKSYISDNIVIGRSVDNTEQQGPVYCNSGKIGLYFTDSVTITDSFEVKEGAELEIKKL